jgi:hypothetical protein
MRPCTCDRVTGQPWTPGQCRLCWLFHHDAAYRGHWGRGEGHPGPVMVALDFALAWLRHARDDFRKATQEAVAARLATCGSCPRGMLSPERVCLACGCLVDLKAAWASEGCPLGFWGPAGGGGGGGCGGCAGAGRAATGAETPPPLAGPGTSGGSR